MRHPLKTLAPLALLAAFFTGCAATAVQSSDRGAALQISLGGSPEWLLAGEGFVSEEDRAVLTELQKSLRSLKANPTEAFLKSFAAELRKAGVFKTVVEDKGDLSLAFNNVRAAYTDGDPSKDLAIHAEGWIGVQLRRRDGTGAWASMVYAGPEDAYKATVSDLVAKPEVLKAFFGDFGRRMGAATAKKMLAQ